MKNSPTRILTIAVILLLLTNIGLIGFILMNKKRTGSHGERKAPFEMISKELNMTEEQQKEYKQLHEEHFKTIRPLFDSVRAAKTAFFALVKEPHVNDSLLDIYSHRIIEKQSQLDRLTFDHFRRVRNMLSVEQQPKFDSIIQKMMQRGRRDSSGKHK